MKINEILTVNNTKAKAHSDSKKNVLELISRLTTSNVKSLDSKVVFNSLVSRERLGSTGLGHGVAIPHSRIDGIDKPIGALVQLAKPINFDAPDDEPVDLLFALLLPKESTEEHLTTLANLAELFSTTEYRERLRRAKNNDDLFNLAVKEK